MSDLNEKLAQEAAELINGGEWRDGKWYSDGHRDAWRRALKPAADRIEKLEEALFESMVLNINYHAVEEKDGYEFTEAPIVIKMALTALEGKDV